jgi:hypothetical protein
MDQKTAATTTTVPLLTDTSFDPSFIYDVLKYQAGTSIPYPRMHRESRGYS